MFPYVCLATMPIFCKANWPRKLLVYTKFSQTNFISSDKDEDKDSSSDDTKLGKLIFQNNICKNKYVLFEFHRLKVKKYAKNSQNQKKNWMGLC